MFYKLIWPAILFYRVLDNRFLNIKEECKFNDSQAKKDVLSV